MCLRCRLQRFADRCSIKFLPGLQWLFVLEGFPAIMLGIVVLCCLAKTPATAGFLRQDEREWLVARQAADSSTLRLCRVAI